MNQTLKTLVFWLVIVVSAFLLWQVVRTGSANQNVPEISYSEFLSRIANGQVSRVTIVGSEVRGLDTKGGSFRVIVSAASQSTMLEALQQKGAEIWFRDASQGGWPNWIMNLAPLALLAALWFFMIRQMQTTSRRLANASSTPGPQDTPPRFGP
jgi:cell division protease FtsH